MTIPAATALAFLPFALPIAIWVAWNDMKFMKIPNQAVLATAIVCVVVGLFAMPFQTYLWHLGQGVAVLAAGFVANLVRAIGAGDAKFAAAAAPMVYAGDLPVFLPLAAAVLLTAFATHRIARNLPPLRRRFPDWQSWTRGDFPMGLALGSLLVFYLGLGAVFGS